MGATHNENRVTIRVMVGDGEAEATGPREWVDAMIAQFVNWMKERTRLRLAEEGDADSGG